MPDTRATYPHVSARPLLLAAACLMGGCTREDPRPNVLLITLDTTRADHLTCYGYERDTSPSLDALAADGVRYTNAYAVSSWTLPAHATLLTGKFPSSHGARYDAEGPLRLTQGIEGDPSWDRYRARGLSPEEVTLGAVLASEGYATCGVVAGPWMKRVFGLDLGFEDYDDEQITELNGRSAANVTERAIGWLDGQERPFFLFLNYYDPHGPLKPPREYLQRYLPEGARMIDLPGDEATAIAYDAEIRYMDDHLGVLFDALKARGLYDDTWIVVTSDHGELFGENGLMGHGRSLTQAEIHIPLIVKQPGATGQARVDEGPVSQVDVLPMILEGLGVDPPPGVQGSPPSRQTSLVVAEVYPLPLSGPGPWRQRGDWQVLIDGSYKFYRSSMGNHLLVDLEADPLEGVDLRELDPERSQRMEERLTRFLAALPPPPSAGAAREVDLDTQRALKNMGYVGGDEDE